MGGGGEIINKTKTNPRSFNKTPKPLVKNLTLKESHAEFRSLKNSLLIAKGNSCDKKAVQ